MNLRTTLIIITASLAVLLLSNCASNSNFYSAKPLGKGNGQGFFAVSKISTEQAADSSDASIIRPDFTIFELGASVGITDKWDVGLKYSFPTAAFIETKYTLVGANNPRGFYFAPGFRGGYTSFGSDEDDNGEDIENSRVELAVPLFLSIYPLEWLGLSVIPTYSFRFFTANSGYTEHILGGNVNLRLGKKIGVIIEGAAHKNFAWDWIEVQGGAAVFLQLESLFK